MIPAVALHGPELADSGSRLRLVHRARFGDTAHMVNVTDITLSLRRARSGRGAIEVSAGWADR